MRQIAQFLLMLNNKYLLTLVVFVVWISFFDRNDLFTQWNRKKELDKLEAGQLYYEQEIDKTRKDLTELDNNPVILEKIAREKFYLKKPGEDVFVLNEAQEK